MILPITRRSFVGGAASLPVLGAGGWPAAGAGQHPGLRFAGVNLAGGEFGRVPGRYGHDYILPKASMLKAASDRGFNIVRVPFLWERIQPRAGAPLARRELARLRHLGSEASRLGMHLILDLHNYARRRFEDDGWQEAHLVGSDRVPNDAFADVWSRLADAFRDQPCTIFGIMNEPHGLPAAHWLDAVNRAVLAIRNAGAHNFILVPGVAFSGAHSWLGSGNTVMADTADPLDRFALEVHQYLDGNSSGTSDEAVSPTIGSERLVDFESWARRKKLKAFLGEFAAANNPVALAALDDMCRHMASNADVWLGWTAWAAGPWWPRSYPFRLAFDRGEAQSPVLEVLAAHAQDTAAGTTCI